jgi:exopolysaccharide biosynthesis polyprenyl glycosylphosphotransferase
MKPPDGEYSPIQSATPAPVSFQVTPAEFDERRNRRSRRSPTLLYFLVDVIGITLGLLSAYFLRFYAGFIEPAGTYDPQDYIRLLPLALLLHLLMLWRFEHYAQKERAFTFRMLRRLAQASLIAVGAIVVLHFFQRNTEYSRLTYPLAVVMVTLITGSLRLGLDRILAYLKIHKKLPTSRILILGTGPTAQALWADIVQRGYLGLEPLGLVSDGTTPPATPSDNSFATHPAHPQPLATPPTQPPPILGSFEQIPDLVRQYRVDEIFVAQPDIPAEVILDFMLECEAADLPVRIAPTALEASIAELTVDRIGGIVLYGLKQTPLRGPWLLIKRAMDIAVSLIVLIVGAPIFLGIALAIKLTSKGPILFRQERVGLDGKPFICLKFRSMRTDAEAQSGPVWAIPDDPRTTPLGRFLRRTNLDELPQVINVLRGEMSLVGPRPERPHFVSQFQTAIPRYMTRHRVKAGITGWAQINGLRGQTPIDKRLLYDLYYVENWSIWLDLKILVATLWATDNAY